MKRIALLIWALVVVLAVLIWRQDEPGDASFAQARLDRPLALWWPAGAEARQAEVPAAIIAEAAVSEPVMAKGCSRLGLFPARGWASEVAEKLAAAAGDEPATAWELLPAGSRGFYIVFPEMNMEGLAGRMVSRRSKVSRLLSAAAVPEACR